MATFFTSDTHFGHTGIIAHCHRQFASVQEMDATLIRNWNAFVGPRDEVWHLGDFTLAGTDDAINYLNQLNGKIHLIWGNHDRNSVRSLSRWVTSDYAREINLDGHKLTLCHYAMRVWNQCARGALMLYGHSHTGLPGTSQSQDVGVDAWDFRPVTLADILHRMAGAPAFASEDHHSPEF
jgi:calcineurin-like phosphoesterase family protein